ncbi:MAG: lactonase family protein [Planctomycetes bacterium]|nr:lactonase family protein [Planctomycetota bacterium]
MERPLPALSVTAVLAAAAIGGALLFAAQPGASPRAAWAVGEVAATYVYVHANDASPQVYAFSLGGDGSLTAVAGSPFAEGGSAGDCSGFCNAMTSSALRGTLLTANGSGVASLAVAGDGSVAPVGGSPFSYDVAELGTSVATVEVGGRAFVYASQYFGDAVDGFEIASDGTLTRIPGMPLTGIDSVGVIAGGGDKLFVCDEKHHRLRAFKVGADGTLTASSTKPTKVPGRGPIYFVTADPTGAFVFTGEWKKGRSIFAFRSDATTGKLAKPKAFGLKVKDADGGISVASNGLVAVFASKGPKDVQILRFAENGRFKKLGVPQASGFTHVTTHAFSPDGAFLIASDGGLDETRSYSVDAVTGKLSLVDTEPTPGSGSLNGIAILQR